jgi:hypothetical protein
VSISPQNAELRKVTSLANLLVLPMSAKKRREKSDNAVTF